MKHTRMSLLENGPKGTKFVNLVALRDDSSAKNKNSFLEHSRSGSMQKNSSIFSRKEDDLGPPVIVQDKGKFHHHRPSYQGPNIPPNITLTWCFKLQTNHMIMVNMSLPRVNVENMQGEKMCFEPRSLYGVISKEN